MARDVRRGRYPCPFERVAARMEDSDASAPIIRTAHRVGYAFVAPLQRVHSSAMSRWVIAGSRRIPLTGGETIIGRDPASTIYLNAAGVSRCHARIVVDGKDVLLEDLGSKNGTIVGGNPLTGRGRCGTETKYASGLYQLFIGHRRGAFRPKYYQSRHFTRPAGNCVCPTAAGGQEWSEEEVSATQI